MNTRHRVQLFFAVLLSGLTPIFLGRHFGWSIWLCVFGSAVLVACTGLLMMARIPRAAAPDVPPVRPPVPEPEPPTELPFREVPLQNLPLPSSRPDYDFRFSATVLWRPTQPLSLTSHANLAGLAADAILVRARQVSANEDPGRPDLLAMRLAGLLGAPAYDGGGLVVAMAAGITVTLTGEDTARLEKMAALRKAEEAWEQQRQYERSRREYFGGEVLKSTGSAVVWWLSRHEEEIEQAVQLIGPLTELAAAANDSDVPEVFRHYVGRRSGAPGDPCEDPEFDDELADLLMQEEQAASGTGDDGFTARVADLMNDLGLSPDSEEGMVWLDRVGRATHAARPDREAAGPDPEDLAGPDGTPDQYDREPPRPGAPWQDFQND
ncbi:hypothetical protein [Kitasatospora cineracea]|uniref:Uncharacterized protein n=2 Tax=Kitasatospora cineracea TaxID=88074 RepID=A0A3N4RPL2_9ACTN|nr:hypothetical protein [Kitasatospora cineracea]ROR44989.1 hypothetical protein EDD39_3200 [Kitasatospora cineracea]RPE35352.1 hypothetical protein EDD38_3701 [Kitasatospora cineracea]